MIKTGILAAAAALTLAVPAFAQAQPAYSYGYAPAYSYDHGDVRRGDWGRIERERDLRRIEELRRLRWERDHYGDRRW